MYANIKSKIQAIYLLPYHSEAMIHPKLKHDYELSPKINTEMTQ